MITEIQIQGQPIDIPNDLEIMLEEISPLYDTTITTGDFSQSFEIPASPQNRRTLQYVDQIHLADKTIRFDDVVIVDDYFGTIRGSILIQETISEFGSGSIDADFFTNLLSIDVFNKQLADVMQITAKADLGTTSAAIIAAAKAQNASSMSADGATGAVLKFVPHFNPEFFDADINPDWNPDANQYNSTQAYSVDDVVIYQQKSAFDQPEKYICISAAAIGETPETHPAKWQKIPFCVLNDWDPDAESFYLNETEKIGNRYFQNFHALVPWIQMHDVIRKAALAIGYSVDGDYLQDFHEQRALLVSNFAQVKPAEYRALLQLNNVADENVLSLPQSGGPTGTLADAIVQDPASENDAEGLFDDTAQEFTVNKKGVYRIRFAGFIWADENGVDDVQLFFNLFDDLANNLAFGKQVFPVGSFPDGSTTQEFEIEIIYEYDYAGDDGSQDLVLELRSEVQETDSLGAVLTNTFISFENITYQGVDQYDGTVYYRDHVPDITVANFLEAIRTWKNLMVSFDGRRKIISFNYADTIITQRKDVLNLDPYQVGGHRLKLKPKKKFKLNYGVLPENTETIFTNYQVGDAVDKIQDLDGYILNNDISPTSKKAILVKSLNAWMLTGASKYSDRTVWTLFSHNWPDLEIEETGDLYEITPELGPVPMGFFKAFSGDLFQAPVLSGLGRSSGQPLNGERPKFMVAYWVGLDTSTISAGYPLATTTKTRSDGQNILNKGMSWLEQYESFWIKTLRAIVQEEIIIRSFMIPPEINQKIKWQTIALISHSPTLIMKKLRSIGSSPMQQMEMRRIKSQDIEVVSQVLVIEDDAPELWSPLELGVDLLAWHDFGNESSVTLDGSDNIEQVDDLSANGFHATQTAEVNRPSYLLNSGTGRKAYRNTGNAHKFLNFTYDLDSEPYTIFSVHRLATNSVYGGLIFSRSPALWGVNTNALAAHYGVYGGGYTNTHYYNGVPTTNGILNQDGFFSFETPGNAINSLYSGTIGKDPTYSNRNSDIWINEIIVVRGTVSEANRKLIEGYQAWKHGLQGNLPSGHPYEAAAPTV